MKVAIVGTGYVGLVTGTCLAEKGHRVTCVDIDEQKVQRMQKGIVPIYEPGLERLFANNKASGNLIFTADMTEGIQDADVIFLALPTPPGEDGSADLSYILSAAERIGPLLSKYTVIVNKSTVPVGTAEKVSDIIARTSFVPQDVVSNPEFLREGVAVEDFMHPDRIVIGTSSAKAKSIMNTLYQSFINKGVPIHYMSERSAELTKYAGNAFLAMKISFMNEMANLSELLGADIDEVRKGVGSDHRIGTQFLYSGIGYGGSCFPKDVQALHKTSEEAQYDFKLLTAVTAVNKLQKKILLNKLHRYLDHHLEGKCIAIWGLSFKPDTDDIREAPSFDIISSLLQSKAIVNVYDPEAMDNTKQQFGNAIHYHTDMYEATKDAEALLILTEWDMFRSADLETIKNTMKNRAVFDGRNIFPLEAMEEAGFHYESIGRKPLHQHPLLTHLKNLAL